MEEKVERIAFIEPCLYRSIWVFFLLLLPAFFLDGIRVREIVDELGAQGFIEKVHGHLVGTFLFTFVYKLNLSSNRRDNPDHITDPDLCFFFIVQDHPSFCSTDRILQGGDAKSCRYAAFFIHQLTATRFK